MSPTEKSVLDQSIKGITARFVWAIIFTTAISCSTALSIYFGMRNQIAILEMQIRYMEERLDRNGIK